MGNPNFHPNPDFLTPGSLGSDHRQDRDGEKGAAHGGEASDEEAVAPDGSLTPWVAKNRPQIHQPTSLLIRAGALPCIKGGFITIGGEHPLIRNLG